MAKPKKDKTVKAKRVRKSSTVDSKESPEQVKDSDFLGTYKDFYDTTSKVVRKAAEVLETEVAAGIKAAKKAESQFLNIEKIRGEKSEEIIQRFRRDAHEVLDILVDFVSVTLKSAGNVTNVVTIRDQCKPSKSEKPTESKPIITPQNSVKPGSSVEIPISLENNGETQTEEFELYSTDLVGDSGQRISSRQINFVPSKLKIPPHLTEKVIVTVSVPREATKGTYSGLVLASNMNQLRSEIVVTVE